MKTKFHKCRNIAHPFPIVAWLIMIFQGMLPWKKESYSHMAISYGPYFFDVTGDKGCRLHNQKEYLATYKIVETHVGTKEITEDVFFKFYSKGFNKKRVCFCLIVNSLSKSRSPIMLNETGLSYRKSEFTPSIK